MLVCKNPAFLKICHVNKAEELGKVFRCMYPGGQDLLISGLPPAQAGIAKIKQVKVPLTYQLQYLPEPC